MFSQTLAEGTARKKVDNETEEDGWFAIGLTNGNNDKFKLIFTTFCRPVVKETDILYIEVIDVNNLLCNAKTWMLLNLRVFLQRSSW